MDCNWILIWFKVQVVAKPWVLILLEPADGPTKPPSHPIQTCSSAVQRPEFRVWYLLINSRMNQCLQPSGSLYHSDLCTWVQACVWIRRRLSHCSFNRPNGGSGKSNGPGAVEGGFSNVSGFDLVQTAEVNYCPRPHVMDVEFPRVIYLNDQSWVS